MIDGGQVFQSSLLPTQPLTLKWRSEEIEMKKEIEKWNSIPRRGQSIILGVRTYHPP